MIHTRRLLRLCRSTLIASVTLMLFACGGGSSSDPDSGEGTTGADSGAGTDSGSGTDSGTGTDSGAGAGSGENALRLVSSISTADLIATDAIAFSPDGTEVAVASRAGDLRLIEVNVYSVETGDRLRTMNSSALVTEFLNASSVEELSWGEDGILTAEIGFDKRIFWASGTGEEINLVELGSTDACNVPAGFLRIFDPSTNRFFASEGFASDDETVCVFNLADQTVSILTIDEPPGKLDSALLSADRQTIWVNYGDPEVPGVGNSWVSTLEYDKATLSATGRSVTEGIVVAITETHRLIKRDFDFILYPSGRQLNLFGTDVMSDPTGQVIVGSAPSVTNSTLQIVSLPEGLLLGELPGDSGTRRAFSQDGRYVALLYSSAIEIYDVTGRDNTSELN